MQEGAALPDKKEAKPLTPQGPGCVDGATGTPPPPPAGNQKPTGGLLTVAAEMTAADHPRWQDARMTRPTAAGEGQLPKTHPSPLRSCQETAPPEQEVRV